jgi:hypothetical protein
MTGAVAGTTIYLLNGNLVKVASVAPVVAKLGAEFGKLGTLVENPGVKVNWEAFAEHGAQRMAARGVTPDMVESWVANGKALAQNGGEKFLFVTQEGVAVVTKEGKLVTTYSASKFDETMLNIVKQLFGE